MNNDCPRLIEVAFPLKQASLDSVHEKNVRHGHISTLHIWPARRPLAACRAALIATLLPDPGNDAERKRLLEKLAGTVRTRNTYKNVGGRKVPVLKEETEGGILHWGRENGPDLDFFREEIKKAYGGRAPRVLDPFAGGGAIPLEAMRLGCEATAIDINPVAWFILKCTLEYPQRLAGQTRPLPSFALQSPEFMEEFWKATGSGRKNGKGREKSSQPSMLEAPEADLAWHVRAWGHWVLERARKDLERFYPTIDGKPTVAYLWARTVTCKNCRATIPLLKTLWLCKTENKRIKLAMKPRCDNLGVDFEVEDETLVDNNAAKRRGQGNQGNQGTLTGSGVWCPVCGTPGTVAMTMGDIQSEFRSCHSGSQMACIICETPYGKKYVLPNPEQLRCAIPPTDQLQNVISSLPFGDMTEQISGTRPSPNARGLSGLPTYGLDEFGKLFTSRQWLALATFAIHTRAVVGCLKESGYPSQWISAIKDFLSLAVDKLADYDSTLCHWSISRETITNTFQRYALRLNWDFVEVNPLASTTGSYRSALDWICQVAKYLTGIYIGGPPSDVRLGSAIYPLNVDKKYYDCMITDPPYYDAIPYADLSDFFYVWLRRIVGDTYSSEFASALVVKDTEVVEHSRFGSSISQARTHYETEMTKAFARMHYGLAIDGRLVVVFANKQPRAWESLVSAIIRSGFVAVASWPIQTEMPNKAAKGARLSSSIWLVCRKRPETARPGWDNQVLEEMRSNIYEKLRGFWDAGIRGPDFVWAATGPAMEAYSKHPVVKKADQPDAIMTVSEFLVHVRRIVVDYVVGHVLSRNGDGQAAEGLDDVTLYYLLHRHDFGLGEAPVGASILYAQSCNLSDRDLATRYDLLAYGKGGKTETETEIETESGTETETDKEGEGETTSSGSTVKLKGWEHRKHKELGLNQGGRIAPLIDQVHRMMHLWQAGDAQKVDGYLEEQGLYLNPVFPRVLQALIELARKDNQPDEVSLLESIMNHITARGAHPQMRLVDSQEDA